MTEKAIIWARAQSAATLVLVSLLFLDIFLILVFLSHRLLGWPSSHFFNIGIDRSIPEYFQYFKELALVVVLAVVYFRERIISVLLWSVLSALLFFDDAFQVHEQFGSVISNYFEFRGAYGIRGQDFGEVLAAAAMAGPIFLGLIVCYYLDTPCRREFSRNMLLLLICLALFGVLIDLFVHSLQSLTLYVIEDGGEMVVISVMLWFALRYLESGKTDLLKQIDQKFA